MTMSAREGNACLLTRSHQEAFSLPRAPVKKPRTARKDAYRRTDAVPLAMCAK